MNMEINKTVISLDLIIICYRIIHLFYFIFEGSNDSPVAYYKLGQYVPALKIRAAEVGYFDEINVNNQLHSFHCNATSCFIECSW